MYTKDFLNDLNIARKDAVYLLILVIFSSLLTVHLINLNLTLNFKPDSFVYLINGLVFGGMTGNIENYSYSMFLSPVIAFLTSILFRLGIVDKLAIMIVTGAIAIFGQIGLYLLFKTRFDEVMSLFGCILFSSFNAVLIYWANGGIDVPVCSFAIFTVLFMILAVNKNPKYYILTSIFLILAIFTKYVALFLIPILLFYYLTKHDFINMVDLALSDRNEFKTIVRDYLRSDEFKYILISIILAIVLFVLVCGVILSYGSHLTFITQSENSISGFNSAKAAKSHFFNSDKKYYIANYDFIFYPHFFNHDLSWIMPLILGLGALVSLVNIYRSREEYKFIKDYNISSIKYLLIALIIILIPIAVLSFKYLSHMITNICFLIACVCIASLADKTGIDKDKFDLNMLFLVWLVVLVVFLSFITIKGFRYLVIALPALVYFILLALETIFYKVKDTNYFKVALIIVMIVLAVYSLTFTFGEFNFADERNNTDLGNVYDYLVKMEPDYVSKNLSSDYSYGSRFGTWELKYDVKYVKFHDLDSSNSDYIISKRDANLQNYTDIYHSGKIHLYQNSKYD